MCVTVLGTCEISNVAKANEVESVPVAVAEVEQKEIKANRGTLNKAENAIDDRDYNTAVELLTGYINLKPNKDEVYKMRGEAYYALRQYKLAQDDFEKAIALKTQDDKYR